MDTERIQPRHAGHFFAKCYAISEKMPRRCPEDEISKENCPEFQPASYPGKFSRNNKGGSKLSRDEYKEEQVIMIMIMMAILPLPAALHHHGDFSNVANFFPIFKRG